MNGNEAFNIIGELVYRVQTDRAFVIKGIFLIVMVLIGHHRGLIRLWPVKIPIAHGINQILGALAGFAVGIVILALTNRVFGW